MKKTVDIDHIQSVINELNQELLLHKGNISIIDYKDGVLFLQLKGSCHGCGASGCGLLANMVYLIKKRLTTIEKVVFV